MCHGYSGDAKTLAATYLDPKPRAFTQISPKELSRARMIHSVTNGREGTAMKRFSLMLSSAEIEAVVDFIRATFMVNQVKNTRYHTPENGWYDHDRYSAAYPFVLGEISLLVSEDELEPAQRIGRQLYMDACISCHDHVSADEQTPPWSPRPLSYPRGEFDHQQANSVDTISGATPYAVHDRPPQIAHLSESEARGKVLFEENCAFCHAMDGTGKNWIGRFLEPPPRDLTKYRANNKKLIKVIRNGLPGTTMPAWKTILSETQLSDLVHYIRRAFLVKDIN